MLSVRIPLAPITNPQQLQLSPLKGLSLVDKENTPPALSGTRVLASKTARRIFQEPAEPAAPPQGDLPCPSAHFPVWACAPLLRPTECDGTATFSHRVP